MGAGTKHRKRFLQEHPICIFCGGSTPAITIEHCPPRSLFQKREWPFGFEFPACQTCNNGSSDEDLLIAMFGRMDPFHNKGNLDGRHPGLMHNVHKQFPNLLSNMMPSASEARKHNRLYGITPPRQV